MKFTNKHPYLFWQLIGWGLLLADVLFLVVIVIIETGTSTEFGEWIYPVMVFTFIGGLFTITVSPIIVYFSRKKLLPDETAQPQNKQLENFIKTKAGQIISVRRGAGRDAAAAFLAICSVIGFAVAAYYLGEYVNLALGFAGMVMMTAAPAGIAGIYLSRKIKSFYTVQSGEKFVDLTSPPDLKALAEEDPPTLFFSGTLPDSLLNFLYNWLRYYLCGERLTLYLIPAPELCRDFQPSDTLSYEDVLMCISTSQLDLSKEKADRFGKECEIMNTVPFHFLARSDDEMDEEQTI